MSAVDLIVDRILSWQLYVRIWLRSEPAASSLAALAVSDDFGADALGWCTLPTTSECRWRPSMMWILRTPFRAFPGRPRPWGSCPIRSHRTAIISRASSARERIDQRIGIVLVAAHAVDVAEKDQLFGPQGLGHGRGRGVGVDVQLFALRLSTHIDGITGTMPA